MSKRKPGKDTFVSRLDGSTKTKADYEKNKAVTIREGLAVAAEAFRLNQEFDVEHKVRMLAAGWNRSNQLIRKLIIGCEGSLDVADRMLDIMNAHGKRTLADAWDTYCEQECVDRENPFRT